MKTLNKIFLVLVTFLLLLTIHKKFWYQDAKNELLSMSEDECIAFCIEQGIHIPPDLDNEYLGSFIKANIRATIQYPNQMQPYNYEVTVSFTKEIHEKVVNYLHGR